MVDVSVVIPCLNEEKTVGVCIEKIQKVFKEHNIDGEIIIVDNKSSDRSRELAIAKGAKVVIEEVRGYGSAYFKGFREARGKYIIMGDADNTYDFSAIPLFLEMLKNQHYDFVTGSRLKGRIVSGAMPWLHRYIGNPILTMFFNYLFATNFSDVLSGFKAFRRDAVLKMHFKKINMAFTAELMAKVAKAKLRMKEIPIAYYPRAKGAYTKLNSFRDGWRYFKLLSSFLPWRMKLLLVTVFVLIVSSLVFMAQVMVLR
jgi:glycosyltransferase involved in cell wall biosynthesis